MTHRHLGRAVFLTATSLALALGGTSAAAAAEAAPAAEPAPSAADAATQGDRLQRVAYFTQWGIYSGYFVRNIAADSSAARLTTINYAFGNVSAQGTCFEANLLGQGDAWADYQRPVGAAESVDGVADTDTQALAGNFNQLRKLKARNPQLKVLMSLGGWTWSKYFSDAALTEASRRTFVASCLDLFVKGNLPNLPDSPGRGGPGAAAGVFDGIDLDWEWPGSEGNTGNIIRPEDKRNFTLLAAEFRRQLDALGRAAHRRYLLTAFLPADPAKVRAGFEVHRVFHHLDYATVQGYDLHGTWESQTNHQAALFSPAGDPSPERFSVDLAIRTYRGLGAPSRKLVVGVPFYSRGWTGVAPVNNGLFQESTGPAPSPLEPGVERYRSLAGATGFTLYRDSRVATAWLFNGTTFWTFDDPTAIRQKMAYVRDRRLGGAMAWSLDSDNGDLVRAMDEGLRR